MSQIPKAVYASASPHVYSGGPVLAFALLQFHARPNRLGAPAMESSQLLIRIYFIFSLLSNYFAYGAGLVSIVSDSGYASERICAQNCIWHAGASDDLIVFLGCTNTNGWLNDCYCRADLQSSANYFITSCVNKACSLNAADLSGASSVYSRYCSNAVGASPANVPATTTAGVNPTAETLVVVTTVLSASGTSRTQDTTLTSIFTSAPPSNIPASSPGTSTTKSTPTMATDPTAVPASSKGGLSTSDKIALGVGLGLGLPTLFMGILTMCLRR